MDEAKKYLLAVIQLHDSLKWPNDGHLNIWHLSIAYQIQFDFSSKLTDKTRQDDNKITTRLIRPPAGSHSL